MKNKRQISIVLLIFILASMACSLGYQPTMEPLPPPPVDVMGTNAAQTMAVVQTQLASTATPFVTLPALPTVPSPTAGMTSTPIPSKTPVPSFTPYGYKPSQTPGGPTSSAITALPGDTCLKGEFVADVTIPDGTRMNPGQTFTKTWRIRNAGTCPWAADFTLIYFKGDKMGGPDFINLPHVVAPGQTIDLSLNLTAPSSNGSYQGYWKFQDQTGVQFGVGSTAQKSIWVQINVGPTPVVFNVTSVKLYTDEKKVTACTYTFVFTADIKTNGPGDLVFYWMHGDSKAQKREVAYGSAGTKTFTHDWSVSVTAGKSKKFKLSLFVENPNNQTFGPLEVQLTCI